MKKGRSVTCVYLVCIFFIFVTNAVAQKTIVLSDYFENFRKTYDLSGSELYMIINGDFLFVPKTAPFEFRTNKIIDSVLASVDTASRIYIVIIKYKDMYVIPISYSILRVRGSWAISIYRDNKKKYCAIRLRETHSVGFCITNMVITPNKRWKRKYYELL